MAADKYCARLNPAILDVHSTCEVQQRAAYEPDTNLKDMNVSQSIHCTLN